MTHISRWPAIAFVALTVAGPALAEEPGKPAAPPAMGGMQHGGGGMMGGGMMGGMMTDAMKEEHLKSKQENFIRMVELSNRILAAKDDKERDKLKAEQLQLMKEQEKAHHEMMMKHMQQMQGMMPQGGGMGGMGGMQHGGGSSGGNMGGMGGMQHGPAAAPAAPAGAWPKTSP
jgi:RNA-binding protein Musashi